uniref:Cytochrome c biogenesis protein CcsA n=1 Tax=Carteria sp. SAG 8-5 TaxID=1756294 RepID=A0A0S2LPL9_9CHLO|nr:heme attachment to plastid cytochrome c [Carteria sp. SAG 8-5]
MMYTKLESLLGNLSFISLFIAMLFFWIYASFFLKKKTTKLRIATALTNTELNRNESKENLWLLFGNIGMILSNITLLLLLLFRWKESGHFPLSNLYESLIFLSWSCTFIHFALFFSAYQEFMTQFPKKELFGNYPNKKSFFYNLISGKEDLSYEKKNRLTSFSKIAGCITSPCALFTNAFASFSLPEEMQKMAPLVPALQSNWLMMHVTVMIISYSALIIGSLLSIAFLVITQNKAFLNFQKSTPSILINSPLIEKEESISLKQQENSISTIQIFAETLDNLSYRILGLGFPFLTIGILSGAVWANEAWGSYWSWDPKETWALLTWLVFAIYLHTRISKGWEGKKPAIIASFGFIVVWACYLGVNLIGEGLHSYGWFNNN